MAIEVKIQRKLSTFELNIDFKSDSKRIGILGASGCGKSMTLKSIAGIEPPEIVSFRRNVSVRILGITLSYICQNEQMDKKARPTRIVRR